MTAIENTDDARLRERMVALARDLILIPTIPSRPDDRKRGFYFVKNHLDTLDPIHVREYEDKGFPSLVATPNGCEHPEILVCAHLDVITHKNLSAYRSEIRDGRIYGPGAGDMKGTLAVLLEVFRTIHRNYPGTPLGFAVTTDEELGGESGIGYLFNTAGVRCGEAMIPDGGSLNDITIEEKGILHLRVRRQGKPAHAARPWLGVNPIEELMDRLSAVREHFAAIARSGDHWRPTCAVTLIRTENETRNRVPADAEAVLDIRFPAPHTVAEITNTLTGILGPDTETETIISAEATRLLPDPAYRETIEAVTGSPARLVKDDGGSDARFVCAHGIPVVMSRPLVGNLHSEDEWIDIESMVAFYHICERYLRRKLGLPG
jgi:succinyl-diaminopimelate desuccinylase